MKEKKNQRKSYITEEIVTLLAIKIRSFFKAARNNVSCFWASLIYVTATGKANKVF